MPEMLALTLHRPWAWAIVGAPAPHAKRIENRSWAPWPRALGQRIALHAGRKWDQEGALLVERYLAFAASLADADHPQGIIGTARIVRAFRRDAADFAALCPASQEHWAFGPWCWVLADVRSLPEPIPCRGRQGLWEMPSALVAKIRSQGGL